MAYTFYDRDFRVIRYADALAEAGHRVDVIALRRPQQARYAVSGRIRVLRIQGRARTERTAGTHLLKTLAFFVKAFALLSVLQLFSRYDIVHVHNVPDFLVFTAILPKWMGARVFLDIHDIEPELYAGKFDANARSMAYRGLLMLERAACWFADHVIVSNDLWREKLIQRSVSPERCTTLLNYPDLRRFKPCQEGQRPRDDRFVVLYPGTLNWHQGVDIAVRAFALVKDRMPRAEFHIYGEGPARGELAQIARESGIGDRVRIMDPVSVDEIAVIMASADLGVVPKRADGFGNEAFSTKILEFMACAVPVVVARTAIDRKYFSEDLVRFFAPGDARDLAETLVSVYEHRSEHHDRVQSAYRFAVANSWQLRLADYRGLVGAVLGQPDARCRTSVTGRE